MSLKIVQVGEPVLREGARTVTSAEIGSDQVQRPILDMRGTMHETPGVGLAAPQIGFSLQLAVMKTGTIISKTSLRKISENGSARRFPSSRCSSSPQRTGRVSR
jgi:peptide deformylase